MSAAKRRLIVTPNARDDLRDILRFTVQTWGKEQRAVYKAKLNAAMRYLPAYPDRGHPRDSLAPGLQALLIEAHVVYYRVDDRSVTVLRILHQNVDASARHFQ